MREINEFITDQTGLSATTQHKIIISILILIFLSIIRLLVLRIVWRQTQNVKIRYSWKRTLSFVIPFSGLILISAVWIHAFEEFGTFLGLFTAGIAIALKDPLTNLAEALVEAESALLREAYELLPRIPFDDLDALIVDEIGKNISGTGMDQNIIARGTNMRANIPGRFTST